MELRHCVGLILAGWLGVSGAWTRAADAPGQFNIEPLTGAGRQSFDLKTGVMKADGGARVCYVTQKGADVELTANRVQLNQATGDALAEGSVFLHSEGHLWRGERLEYNFKTKVMKGEEFRTGAGNYFLAGMDLASDPAANTKSATNATITTDNYAEPGYRIRCRKLTLIPGKSFTAEECTFYVGDTPVMYLPRYTRDLVKHGDYWVLTPGYRSIYGPYVLGTYHHVFTTNFTTDLHLDYRQLRGVGGGADAHYNAGPWGLGEVKVYYAHDDRPGTNGLGQGLSSERQRLSFSHQVEVRTNLTVKAVVNEQSDATMVRDFLLPQYYRDPQPKTFVEVNQLWSNWSLNILAQPRINDFFETVERLPDVKLTGFRQEIGVTPLYYESESSAGYFRHSFADNVTNTFAATRADTYHQIVLPETFFGWLNVTPRVGGRFTHYSETEGLGVAFTEANRTVFNTGCEVTFKLHQTLPDKEVPWLQAKGLRHIIEPGFNYAYVPSPNRLPTTLPQFDGEQASLRLLPIEFPDYNAIDSVDSENVLRLSLRNTVQTKRNGHVDNLLRWALYTDWRLSPRAGQGTFSDGFSDLEFRPRDWLTLSSETRYNFDSGHWRVADHRATFTPGSDLSMQLGHRYVRTDPTFLTGPGNNLITTSFHYRMNENYALRTRHFFEARNGRMEEQSYSLYRDFRAWTGALTLRIRDLGNNVHDYTIGFTYNLKSFPHYKVGHDAETVATML